MTEPGTELPEEAGIESGGSLRAWHLALIVIVAVGVVGGYYWWSGRTPRDADPVRSQGPVEVPEGSRTVTLFFASDEDPVIVPETRQVAMGKGLVDQAEKVLLALLGGPERAGASTIPDGTRLRGVFYDNGSATLYIDFSADLVAAHPGGAAAETSTVMAIMKTVSENFPEVQAVQVLIEGYQVGTIAGHVDAYQPFHVQDWR